MVSGTRASGRILGANDRLRIAVAGCNGRGQSHIDGWLSQPNVEIVYLIDPDQRVLDRALKSLQGKSQKASAKNAGAAGKFTCQGVTEVRKALADPTLDAIFHRHAQSLAFLDDDLGGTGGQARLCGKTDEP